MFHPRNKKIDRWMDGWMDRERERERETSAFNRITSSLGVGNNLV